MANAGKLLSDSSLLEAEAIRVGKLCVEEPAKNDNMNEGIDKEEDFLKIVSGIGYCDPGEYEGSCACGQEDL